MHGFLSRWILMTAATLFLLAGCGGNGDTEAEEATRVAEAVAATLTAQADGADAGTDDGVANDGAAAEDDETAVAPSAAATATDTPQAVAQADDDAATATPTTAPTATPTPIVATVIPAATPTDEPTATPTPIIAAVIPADGSDGEGREILIGDNGRAILLPGIPDSAVTQPMIFRDVLTARVQVYDDRRDAKQDGDGIASVVFAVTGPNGQETTKVEEDAAYCLFGGSEPDCPGIRLGDNENWPAGPYATQITITADDGLESVWFWQFCVDRCEVEAPPDAGAAAAEIVAEIVETQPDSVATTITEALTFRVEAFDPAVGEMDGAGIAGVLLQVVGPDGNIVYQKVEESAAYCAFGGDLPCPAWVFADYENRWPDGAAVVDGPHLLRALVQTTDDRRAAVELPVTIQLEGDAGYGRTDEAGEADDDEEAHDEPGYNAPGTVPDAGG